MSSKKEELNQINKKILELFKDHVEWKNFEDVLYPFWINELQAKFGEWTFTEWSEHMTQLLQKKNEVPVVKPKIDFDTSGKSFMLQFNEVKTKGKF